MIRLCSALLACFALTTVLAAQSQPKSVPKGTEDTQATKANQDQAKELARIAEELKSVREQQEGYAAEARNRANQKPYPGPPVWSNWMLAVISAAAGLTAYLAFKSQRDAVRLTQRADVLIHSVDISTYPNPLTPATKISVIFKNYGPTRASNLRLEAALEYDDIRGLPQRERIPITLAAGENQVITFDPMGMHMKAETAQAIADGTAPFTFVAEATYFDVFGKKHHTLDRGSYRAKARTFEITQTYSD